MICIAVREKVEKFKHPLTFLPFFKYSAQIETIIILFLQEYRVYQFLGMSTVIDIYFVQGV